jgi:chaperonin GroEL
MAKQFRFGQEALTSLVKGIDTVAKSVGSSLGPRGKLTLIQSPGSDVSRCTKDGVTIARSSLPLKDPFEQQGAELVVETAKKTVEQVGDGTTGATILTSRLVAEGARLVAAGLNPIDIKRGIEYGTQKVVEELKSMSRPVSGQLEIEQVATVSANGDAEIGKLIAEAMEKVGNNGIINLGEGKTFKTEIEVVPGFRVDRGYLSPHFVLPGSEKPEVVLDNPLVLIYDKPIGNLALIMPVLKACHETYPGRPLFVCAENVDSEALGTMLLNHIKRSFTSCAIKLPAFGDRRKEIVRDMAILTGATMISDDLGMKLESFDVAWLGSAKKIVITKGNTTIIEGGGSEEAMAARIEEIRGTIQTLSGHDKEIQEERLAQLIGGVAQILVGGNTESEMLERKDRVEDALAAVRALIQEGYVTGGGVALLRAATVLDRIDIPADLKVGCQIVRKACEEPLRKIVDNCGGDPTLVRLKILESTSNDFGFNARTEKFTNLIEEGIIDPAMVIRCSLQNASTTAGIILTTECLICDEPEPQHNPQNGMM